MATLSCFFHLMTIFLYSSLLLILFSYFPDESLALESHFGSDEISSLVTAPECSRHLNELNGRQQLTLEVFHRHGPNNMPSAKDILHQDRLRVQSLQARSNPNEYHSQSQDTTEVANLTVPYSNGLYTVNISLGTPPQELTLLFDTATNLTWARCFNSSPMTNFNSLASTSFVNITCGDSICSDMLPYHKCDKSNNICLFTIEYADRSNSTGAFSTDTLTITQTGDVFPDFKFGCAQEINGWYYDNVTGLLGLGRKDVSFLEQTKQTYLGVFSYCLPSTGSSTGFLKLGPRDYPSDLEFTPLRLSNEQIYSSFYFIDITSISVGSVLLPIDPLYLEQLGTIIDSGTVITYLSMNVYKSMRDEFQKQMTNAGYRLIVPGARALLDTCYDISVYNNNNVPTISFTFNGNVTVHLNDSAILYAFNSTLACLAFAGNEHDYDLVVFGNTQQRTFEVVYDVYRAKLGFIPGGCN